ncbi:hypothetical protein IJG28_01285 [Candidatus Saccharibacteria bacterium]|nr:hypothetical protein [Candidatus Saccharibacteria bacterium]
MTDIANLSNVAYKKGNWMRYSLWALAALCIGVLIYSFVNMMNGEVSASVPEGYRFVVTDNYVEGSNIRTRYYVYDDKILVEDESTNDNVVSRTVMIYDSVSTSGLEYDEETLELCELGSCKEKPKILSTIKSLISRKIGREYIGL